MDLKTKFEVIVSTVEENIDKDVTEISTIAGAKLGQYRRTIPEAFAFMTGILLKDYVKKRKFKVMIDEIKARGSDEKGVIDNVAVEFGYSERAPFEKAFKHAYNVTPAQAIKSGMEFKESEPISFDSVLEGIESGDNTAKPIVINEETTKAVIDNMVENGKLIIDFQSENDRNTITDILDCQSMFGLSTAEVLLAYELSDDKSFNGLARACSELSNYSLFLEIDKMTRDERDSLYLAINNNLYFHEALRMVSDLRNGSNIDIHQIDKNYLNLVSKYNYGDNSILNHLPYDMYENCKGFLIWLYEDMASHRFGPDGVHEYKMPITDGKYPPLFLEACSNITQYCDEKQISNPSETDLIMMQIAVGAVKGMSRLIPKSDAKLIADEFVMNDIYDLYNGDPEYIEFLFDSRVEVCCTYEGYLHMKKELIDNGITDKEDIDLVISHYDGKSDIIDIAESVLFDKMLCRKYQIRDVSELKDMCNNFITIEDLCYGLKNDVGKESFAPVSIYRTFAKHHDARVSDQLNERRREYFKRTFASPGEKLALMLSLNCNVPYSDMKDILVAEFEKCNESFEFSNDAYYEMNKYLADTRDDRDFERVSLSDFQQITNYFAEKGSLNNLFAEIAFICVRKAMYPTLDEAITALKKLEVEEWFLNEEDINIVELIELFNSNFNNKAPHELEIIEINSLLEAATHHVSYQEGQELFDQSRKIWNSLKKPRIIE